MRLPTLLRDVPVLLFVAIVGFFSAPYAVSAAGEPVVTSRFAESTMPTSAVPTAEVTDEGLAPVVGVWVEYGLTDSYGTEQQRYNLNELTIPGVINASLTGLECDTTYHYRFRVRNNALLDGYSPDMTFTTSPCYPSDIVSHWTLNEGTGTRADSYGENDLTAVNDPVALTGQINDGVQATSSGSEYLSISDNASLSTGGETSFTISLWVKLDSKTGTQVFVSKYGTGGEYAVYYENVFDRFVFSTYPGGGNSYVLADELGSPSTGVWYYITATHDAVANTNSITVNNGTPDVLVGVSEHTDSTANFLIGAFGPTPTFFADAVIDDVRFSKTVHSSPDPVEFAGGIGTELDPYQINACDQLQAINEDLDAHYVLIADVDCSETSGWNANEDEWVDGVVGGELIPDEYDTLVYGAENLPETPTVVNNGYRGFDPIGRSNALNTEGPGFTGVFDGAGYTISDLWIFRKNQPHVGLFGFSAGGTIKNTTLADSRIVGQQNVGGFVGYGAEATLDQLTSTNGMVRAYLSYRGGGIAGFLTNTSSLDNGQVTGGNVHGSGNVIGGLVGHLSGSEAEDSQSSALVDGGEFIGGAFGDVDDSQITRVNATGNVISNLLENGQPGSEIWIAKSGNYSGGFAGRISSSTVTDSYATGSVSSEGNYSGGFAGTIDGSSTITDTYATGSVTSTSSHAGGFAGQTFGSVTVTGSYATGNVSGDSYVGGFTGSAYCGPSFTRAYASGDVTATGSQVGGFVGSDGCEGPGASYSQASASGTVTGIDRVGGFSGESYVSDFADVYATGAVSGTDSVGGFLGYALYPKMANAYSSGQVTGSTNTGGFIGVHYAGSEDRVVTNSFFDSERSGYENAVGDGSDSGITAKISLQMKTASTFTDAGWDFEDIWEIDGDNDGYPHFIWENLPSDTYELVTLEAENISKTAAVLRGRVLSGEFPENALGFAVAPVPFESFEGSPWLIGPADEFGTLPNEGGIYTLDLNTFFASDNYLELPGLTCNTTYYYQAIGYIGFGEGGLVVADDILSFTTSACDEVDPEPEPVRRRSRVVGGFAAPSAFTSQKSATAPSVSTTDTCPADQTLTQNLRSGARDGRYHPYTKAIVTEAKILQAHLNRLGFNSGPVDGILGPISDGAIKRMQTFLGTIPDGFVGPITRGLLNKSCGTDGLKKA